MKGPTPPTRGVLGTQYMGDDGLTCILHTEYCICTLHQVNIKN